MTWGVAVGILSLSTVLLFGLLRGRIGNRIRALSTGVRMFDNKSCYLL